MPKVQAQETLLHKGEIVTIGNVVELTNEQIKALGSKVKPLEEAEVNTNIVYTEDTFAALTADQQKAVVEGYGGDLKEHSNPEKRWAFVAEKQQ